MGDKRQMATPADQPSTLFDEGNGAPYWWNVESGCLSPMAMGFARGLMRAAGKPGQKGAE